MKHLLFILLMSISFMGYSQEKVQLAGIEYTYAQDYTMEETGITYKMFVPFRDNYPAPLTPKTAEKILNYLDTKYSLFRTEEVYEKGVNTGTIFIYENGYMFSLMKAGSVYQTVLFVSKIKAL